MILEPGKKRWDKAADATLRRLYAENMTFAEIAATTGRSRRAIAHRASKLGLRLPPDEYKRRCRAGAQGARKGRSKYASEEQKKSAQRARQKAYRSTPAARKLQGDWAKRNAAAHPIKHLLRIAKKRARSKGIEFSITEADVVATDTCPILGVKITALGTWHGPSLDRRDNSKGYVPGNVFVVSKRGNTWKGARKVNDFKRAIAYLTGGEP